MSKKKTDATAGQPLLQVARAPSRPCDRPVRATKASSSLARLEEVATSLQSKGLDEGLENLGRKRNSEKPVIGGTPSKKAGRQSRLTGAEQSAEFERVARQLGCGEDAERLEGREPTKPKADP